MLLKAVIVSTLIINTLLSVKLKPPTDKAQAYEDRRCRCLCPSPAEVFNATLSARKYFVTDVPPNQCNCDGVILPRIGEEIKGRENEFCPRCECKYETRNTTIIKVVVITVLWLTTLLVVYAVFLTCLDPLMKRQPARHFKDHNSEEARLLMQNYDEED